MKCFLALLVVSVILAASFADKEEDDAFEKFKKANGKKYNSGWEEGMRKALFAKTHRKINEHNSKGLSWKLAHNERSDWTDKQKKATRGFKLSSPSINTRPSRTSKQGRPVVQNREFLTSIDYRDSECMQPIMNQDNCGNCYTYAAIQPLEFSHCQATGEIIKLSEQHVTDCALGYNGCLGGDYIAVGKYLMSIDGSASEASYPRMDSSKNESETCKTSYDAVAKPVTSFSLTYDAKTNAWLPNADAILEAVQYGPVAASFYASAENFDSFKSGIYADNTCNNKGADHAVSIVGYGTCPTTNIPFWIVRNSWGTGFGEDGYFKIKRGVNQCSIEQYVAEFYV